MYEKDMHRAFYFDYNCKSVSVKVGKQLMRGYICGKIGKTNT